MFGWLQRGGRTPGWLAVSFDEASLEFAHARRVRGAKAQVASYAARELGHGKSSIERATREFKLASYQCATLLRAGEYDIHLVEAPNVPRTEMKAALRWKVKDMVTYSMDQATVDFLDIPPEEGAAEGRSQQVYAILARNEVIQARIHRFDEAGIPLAVIDIPETAQRNLASLYEEQDRAVALAHFGRNSGLLTISHRGELYLARRLDLGFEELAADADAIDGGPHERVVLEIQRTLDHFERQFRHVAVGKLLLAPTGHAIGLREILAERFEMPVQQIDLNEVLAFGAERPDEETQGRLFHHFGAALRDAAAP
jgi:MSHA biogenesis protein MshI